MLRDREVIRAGWSLGEHAQLVDEIGDELAPQHLEYLDGLPRGLQGGALSSPVARRTVAIDQDFSPPSQSQRIMNVARLAAGLLTILAQPEGR